MDEYEINLLLDSITKVFEKHTGKEFDSTLLSVKKFAHQYSNTKVPVYRLFFDNKIINNKNSFAVDYKCIFCQHPNTVALNNIKRKINKGMKRCVHCAETEEKISAHKQFWVDLRDGKVKTKAQEPKQKLSILENLKNAEIEFSNEDDDFQHMYFRKHLTKEEFERIRKNIVSIRNGVITKDKFETLVYYPCVKVYNQTKYTPYMYDEKNDTLVKINYITYNCDICQSHFIGRDLFTQKNKSKILCHNCNFCNNIFKIRNAKNAFGESLTYQSQYELKFIRYCNENKIRLLNGPKIKYNWNNLERTYNVDFYIPKLNILIELKDNHHFRMETQNFCRENLKNGKWNAKEEAVKKYCEQNNLKFKLVYPKNYIKECSFISKEISKLSTNY